MFLKRISLGVTMHQFDVPPATVLDVGCGSGLWCIEAAKQWPVSEHMTACATDPL